MGYAKYSEDIDKIHDANVFGSCLDFDALSALHHHRCSLCSFESTTRDKFEAHLLTAHRDAAVYLEHAHHVVPDRAVFGVRPIRLTVRCPGLSVAVEVTVGSRSTGPATHRYSDGQELTLSPPDEENTQLTLRVGPYARNYSISFKRHISQARITPHLISTIRAANINISHWGWHELRQFEQDMHSETSLGPAETQHRHAVTEYYVGLHLEQSRKPEYRRHFESAFDVLRNFDDSLALLISSYFLYRVNAFSSVSSSLPFPRLNRVIAFFGSAADARPTETAPSYDREHRQFVPCEIAIADGDAAVFAAVTALLSSRTIEATDACDLADSLLLDDDDQGRARLWFLRCRLAHQMNDPVAAHEYATKLTQCSVPSFRADARRFLEMR